eukprot:scaffold884_cov322-Pavlova_lutheri.AAC.1
MQRNKDSSSCLRNIRLNDSPIHRSPVSKAATAAERFPLHCEAKGGHPWVSPEDKETTKPKQPKDSYIDRLAEPFPTTFPPQTTAKEREHSRKKEDARRSTRLGSLFTPATSNRKDSRRR